MNEAPPSYEFQVRFLQQVQRIVAEDSFVATYKFAQLHALADLAVLKRDDSGNELTQLLLICAGNTTIPMPLPSL